MKKKNRVIHGKNGRRIEIQYDLPGIEKQVSIYDPRAAIKALIKMPGGISNLPEDLKLKYRKGELL